MNKRSIVGRSAATCAALLAAALAAPGAAQPGDDAEAGVTPSGPQSCLPHPAINRTKILNGRHIIFVTRDDTIYNNELAKECPSLKRNSLVNYGVRNGRICAGDRVQVLWETTPKNYIPTSYCQLGAFVPITAAELEDLMAMTEENREQGRRGRSSREAVTTEEVEPPAEETTPSAGKTAPGAEPALADD